MWSTYLDYPALLAHGGSTYLSTNIIYTVNTHAHTDVCMYVYSPVHRGKLPLTMNDSLFCYGPKGIIWLIIFTQITAVLSKACVAAYIYCLSELSS